MRADPLRLVRRLPVERLAPQSVALDRARQARVEGLLAAYAPRVTALRAALRVLDEARAALDDDGLRPARREALEADARHAEGVVHGAAAQLVGALRATGGEAPQRALDALVRTQRRELLDLPAVPAAVHRAEMFLLDTLNRRTGNYEAWSALIAALTRETAEREGRVRVYDLAAGSGGLVRAMAASPPRVGVRYELTASDLSPVHVAQARAAALRDKLAPDAARFEVRDALALEPLRGQVDLFVCTQSTHHMPPGVVLRLLDAAARRATHGVLVVDVFRSLALSLGAGVLASLVAPFPPLVFDALWSVRRGYTPAELLLLARAAGLAHAHARPASPGYAVLHAASAPQRDSLEGLATASL